MALVELQALAKSYDKVPAVLPLDLSFDSGEFLAILGPSGCGKTTLLKMLGGFVLPTSGRILIAGEDVTHLPPEKRPTNMVFQGYGLFPHMTVRQNIAYGPRIARQENVPARVDEMLAQVRLQDFAEKHPTALSGGQQQRVALARALIMRPKVLLLDEPFAALDLKLRQAMQDELRSLHKAIGGTFVFVTHDQAEAMALATKIVVMSKGRVEQAGTAEEIYRKPATHFVSTFVGEANFLELQGRRVGVRPERILIDSSLKGGLNATVQDRLFLGPHVEYHVMLSDGQHLKLTTQVASFKPGDAVMVSWSPQDQWDEGQ